MVEPAQCLRTAAFPLVRVIVEEHPREALQITLKALECGLSRVAFPMLQHLLVVHRGAAFWSAILTEMEAVTQFALGCDLTESSGFILAYVGSDTVA
jgi:hypothetical protein